MTVLLYPIEFIGYYSALEKISLIRVNNLGRVRFTVAAVAATAVVGS